MQIIGPALNQRTQCEEVLRSLPMWFGMGENHMPMLRMAMYAKNVALYCAPTADDRDTWMSSMQLIALEGLCFVLTTCQFIHKRDLPDNVRVSLGDSPDPVLMRGGSAIVRPLGTVLAVPHFDGEAILTATLDLGEIGHGKCDSTSSATAVDRT